MTEYYSRNPRFFVAVDCIIFGVNEGELSILLTKRRFEPEKGKWSLMGGFVGEDESIDDAAKRVLSELTGLNNVYMEQVGAFGELDRDPGERVISIAYFALIKFNELDRQKVLEHNACWISLKKIPPLGFDHPLMIEKAFELMRRKISYQPIGFNLLPELFTLSQLQTLHESILGEQLDKRNFRKRILETGCVEKTEFIDKTGSRRGATLYRFNKKGYLNGQKFKI